MRTLRRFSEVLSDDAGPRDGESLWSVSSVRGASVAVDSIPCSSNLSWTHSLGYRGQGGVGGVSAAVEQTYRGSEVRRGRKSMSEER